MNKVVRRIKLYLRLKDVTKEILKIDGEMDAFSDKIDKLWKSKKLKYNPVRRNVLIDTIARKHCERAKKRNMLIKEQQYILRSLYK